MNTTIEWLFEQLWETPKDKFVWNSILQEALEKEKQQIMDAYEAAMERPIENYAEAYYNMNYNQNK